MTSNAEQEVECLSLGDSDFHDEILFFINSILLIDICCMI